MARGGKPRSEQVRVEAGVKADAICTAWSFPDLTHRVGSAWANFRNRGSSRSRVFRHPRLSTATRLSVEVYDGNAFDSGYWAFDAKRHKWSRAHGACGTARPDDGRHLQIFSENKRAAYGSVNLWWWWRKKLAPTRGQLILLARARLAPQRRGVLSPPPPVMAATPPTPTTVSTPPTPSVSTPTTTPTVSTPTPSTAMVMTISTSVCACGPRRGGCHKPRYPGNR